MERVEFAIANVLLAKISITIIGVCDEKSNLCSDSFHAGWLWAKVSGIR